MKFKEPVVFNMATMPPRIKALEEVVPKILPQCDKLNIYLNDFVVVPEFLIHPKIKIFRSQDCMGDLGDVGKFYDCENWTKGYIFTIDDKLLYPGNYAEYMISKIEEYKRKAVVSAHGRIFHDRKCTSYYFDAKEFYGILQARPEDAFVHEIGTGGMAFHVSTLPKLDLHTLFPTINMTDIWFSVYLQKLKIPLLNPKRSYFWVGISKKHDDNYSIHNFCNKNDSYQTKIVNSIKWEINTCNK